MRECSLCGGKLDDNKRCTLCGLDNTKNDDMYKHLVNRNECEHAPLTHVHEEHVKKTYIKTNSGNRHSKGTLATIVSILTIIVALIGVVSSIFEDFSIEFEEAYVNEDYNPYECIVDDMPEDGERYVATLDPGIYRVGLDIPMGVYNAVIVAGDYGYVEINDGRNGIYLSENIGFEEQEIVSDLRLYNNALFSVSSNVTVKIVAQNAQSLTIIGQNNPLKDSVVLRERTLIAGDDFEAGVYDVSYQTTGEYENGYVEYKITDGEGYDYEWSIYFVSNAGSQIYRNVVLPEGAEIFLEDLQKVTLVPSARVESTDYEEFYEQYY